MNHLYTKKFLVGVPLISSYGSPQLACHGNSRFKPYVDPTAYEDPNQVFYYNFITIFINLAYTFFLNGTYFSFFPLVIRFFRHRSIFAADRNCHICCSTALLRKFVKKVESVVFN